MSAKHTAQILTGVGSHKVDDESLTNLDEFLTNRNNLEYTFTNTMGETYTIERTSEGFIAGEIHSTGDPTTVDILDAYLRYANKN